MKPRHLTALALVGQCCLIFGVFSLLLSMVGFFLALGYGNDSALATVFMYIAFWPDLTLDHFLSDRTQLNLLFDYPITTVFGIPLVGWACLGIPAGLWRARRLGKLSPLTFQPTPLKPE
jgi:hypothetical protein